MRNAFSKTGLDRMHEVMRGYVERGVAAGLVTLVQRDGETHVDVIGAQSLGGPPMTRDTIFRIASMSKPVTAVAALILVEECTLRLDDPVDELLLELAKRRVIADFFGPLEDTVPANRPVTVRDLLTFRSGDGLTFAMLGSHRCPTQPRPSCRWVRRSHGRLSHPTHGCARSEPFRSCISPASSGCTTPAPTS